MFSDCNFPSVSFKHHLKKTRQAKNASVQSDPLQTGETFAQTDHSNHVTTQTDPEPTNLVLKFDQVDWNKLNVFLKSLEPKIVEILAKNRQQTSIFNAYLTNFDESRDFQAQLIRTLKHSDVSEECQVLCVTWNSTGNTIAAAFGHNGHDNWCTHRGWLCTWNVQRRIMDPEKADWSTDFAACCTCSAYHPKDQSLLAAGTYAGELFVFGADGETVGRATAGDQQSITCLTWSTIDNRLFSGGSGGRIFLWKLSSRGSQDLQLIQRFRISVGNLPRNLRSSDVARGTGVNVLLLSKKDPDRFLAVTETGGVFYCNFKTRNIVEDTLAGFQVEIQDSAAVAYDPVVLALQPHVGPVLDASASPFFDRIYATAGSDGSLCIRDALKTAPVFQADLNIGTIHSCAWSSARPAVLICSSAKHPLVAIDLANVAEKSIISPVFIDIGDGSGSTPANSGATPSFKQSDTNTCCLAFNASRDRSDWLAIGNERGMIGVWRLGDWFASVQSLDEMKIVENLEALNFWIGD